MLYFFLVFCCKYVGNLFLNVNYKYKIWNMIIFFLKILFFFVLYYKVFEIVVSLIEEGFIDIGMIIGCVIIFYVLYLWLIFKNELLVYLW